MNFKSNLGIVVLCLLLGCSSNKQLTNNCAPSKLKAATDFTNFKVDGFKPAYFNKAKTIVGINAGKFKDVFAAAATTYKGPAGIYDIKINTKCELDGESRYRLAINGKQQAKTFQNPVIFGTGKKDYWPTSHTWKNITLKKGDEIRVEFSSETNKKIPEGNGTAYSRGRWTSIELSCP